LAAAWLATLVETPPGHPADAEVWIGESRRYWLELKSRALSFQPPTFPDLVLESAKVERLVALDRPAYVVMHSQPDDALYSIPVGVICDCPQRGFERRKPRPSGAVLATDQQLAYFIPLRLFTLVRETR